MNLPDRSCGDRLGINILKYLQNSPNLLARNSFQSHTLIANPLALKQRVRYIDTDLNRCFNQKDLVNPDCQQYEQKAIAVLLTLLHLGMQNIRLGPTLPAFISPNPFTVVFCLLPLASSQQAI